MRFNSVIFLIKVTHGENEIGDLIETTDKRQTFAEKKSVRQSEFYQAAATGLKPEVTFNIWNQEYNGESQLEYDEKIYTIIRVFQKNNKEVELICSGLVVQ